MLPCLRGYHDASPCSCIELYYYSVGDVLSNCKKMTRSRLPSLHCFNSCHPLGSERTRIICKVQPCKFLVNITGGKYWFIPWDIRDFDIYPYTFTIISWLWYQCLTMQPPCGSMIDDQGSKIEERWSKRPPLILQTPRQTSSKHLPSGRRFRILEIWFL